MRNITSFDGSKGVVEKASIVLKYIKMKARKNNLTPEAVKSRDARNSLLSSCSRVEEFSFVINVC